MKKQLITIAQTKLHSGRSSIFKIDCDTLSDSEIETIAKLFLHLLPPFSSVEGVPTGGLRLARALIPYCSTHGWLLIVDDVLTTGCSMRNLRAGRPAVGAVIFSRGPCPGWITPMFSLNGRLNSM